MITFDYIWLHFIASWYLTFCFRKCSKGPRCNHEPILLHFITFDCINVKHNSVYFCKKKKQWPILIHLFTFDYILEFRFLFLYKQVCIFWQENKWNPDVPKLSVATLKGSRRLNTWMLLGLTYPFHGVRPANAPTPLFTTLWRPHVDPNRNPNHTQIRTKSDSNRMQIWPKSHQNRIKIEPKSH